jgi:hypothetical protein
MVVGFIVGSALWRSTWMDERDLREKAASAFPLKKGRVGQYFSLLSSVKRYEKLMENPDSPWICSSYNNALVNRDNFCRSHPDIVHWIEQRRETNPGSGGNA